MGNQQQEGNVGSVLSQTNIMKQKEEDNKKGEINMHLTEYIKEAHKIAKDHGWWDRRRDEPECILLVHCELSEAVEEIRHDNPHKTEEEVADVFIRLFDMCAVFHPNIEEAIQAKMEKNRNRPYRHGDKKL